MNPPEYDIYMMKHGGGRIILGSFVSHTTEVDGL